MRRGNTIIAIVVAVLALIFFVFALVYYVIYRQINLAKAIGELFIGGSGSTAQAAVMKPINCGGVAVPTVYLTYIKQYANRYLGGDYAVIIAVIERESGFNPKDISNSGAVGIAQFVGPTAQGLKDDTEKNIALFKGLTITVVPRADKSDKHFVTPAEKAAFLQNFPLSGRLHPLPSIEALAYKMKNALKVQGGNLREAYAINYHTIGKKGEHKAAAYAAADKIVATYNKINDGGGCQELKDILGKLGEDINKLAKTK